jgi:hypothetical protein
MNMQAQILLFPHVHFTLKRITLLYLFILCAEFAFNMRNAFKIDTTEMCIEMQSVMWEKVPVGILFNFRILSSFQLKLLI